MNNELYCPKCEDYRDFRTEKRNETYTVKGKKFTIAVEVKVCTTCGESLSQREEDQKVLDQVIAAYREQAHLLTPTQIKSIRERYALSQKSLATLLGMSEATINRYEQGRLQDPSHDALLRACEDPEFVRERLALKGNLLSEWQKKRVEELLYRENSDSDLKPNRWIAFNGILPMQDEISSYTGYRRFDLHRYAFVVVYLCKKLGAISKTKLNKLLFYVDFLNFKVSTVSITGAAYRKIQYGPAPAAYEQLLSELENRQVVRLMERVYGNGHTGLDILAGPSANSIEHPLTKNELKVLDYVAEKFRSTTAEVISDQSHQETAFLETEDKQLISYEKAVNISLSML